MFSIGDCIDYGFYSNLIIVFEIGNEFILQDKNGNTKKVFKELVQRYSVYSGDIQNSKLVLMKDGSKFLLAQISKSNKSVRRLLAVLDIELYWESTTIHDKLGILRNRLPRELQGDRQYLLVESLYMSAVLPDVALIKALKYIGLTGDAIVRELGYRPPRGV